MGILSDFFLADPTPVPSYDGGAEFDASDKCQYTELTALQAGQILAVLRGHKYVADMIREFELVTPDDAEDWTMSVPQDMVDALARVQTERIPPLADQFAQATKEELGWSPDDFATVITELSALARRAIATNKKMYLWNSL